MKQLFRIGLALLVFAATLSLCPVAFAWQNGPSTRRLGDTTVQQWVLARAVSQAVLSGSDWVDLSAALQSVSLPDTVARDYRYHKYVRRGGGHKSAAPERTAVYFALVRDALQAGDRVTASRLLGMLAHYYTDACDPLHTGASRAERRMHRRFERDVMALLNAHGRFEGHLEAALTASDQYAATGAAHEASVAGIGQDVAAFTAASARRAHHGYRKLVRGYVRRGFTRRASRIAASTLERSVQGVAGLIEAAAQPASIVPAPPAGSPALLSTGRAASASSEDVLYHAARFANDGDRRSTWVAAVGGYPQWWQVDLGETRELGSIAIDWYKGSGRSYTYDIHVSADGTTWLPLVDQSSRGTFGSSNDPLAGAPARYVRVNVLGYGVGRRPGKDSASAAPAAISEARVYAPGEPEPSPTPTPTPTPTPPSSGATITVAGTSAASIDAAFAKARAGDTVYFPEGAYTHSTLTIPDAVNIKGAGIGKTRLDFSATFGSHSLIGGQSPGDGLRLGGTGCSARNRNGAHDTTFSWVRFRGGKTDSVVWLGRYDRYTKTSWPLASSVTGGVETPYDPANNSADHIAFRDCEFERPQYSNADYLNGGGQDVVSIWGNNLAGETNIHHISFDRCHFGVDNGAAGTEGYGAGRVAIIIQSVPHEYSWRSDRPDYFLTDWSLFAQNQHDFTITDCVFEQSYWCTINPCDHARAWGVAHGYPAGTLPEGAAPDVTFIRNVTINRCTFKGSGLYTGSSSSPVRYEIGKNCTNDGNEVWLGNSTGSGIAASSAGSVGNSVTNTVTHAGFGTYTPSPFDP